MRRIGVVALCCFVLAGVARAQDLEYTSTMRFRLAPTLSPMSAQLNAAPAMSSHVFWKASRLRMDVGSMTTIVDADRRQMVLLDHGRRRYSIAPLREPDARTDSLARGAHAVLTVERTRDVRKVNGVSARRSSIVVRVPARNARAARASDLVVVNEVWTSDANGIGRAYDRLGRLAEQLRGTQSMFLGLIAQDPRAAVAVRKAAQAASQLRGMPVRAILTYGNIAAGTRFTAGMRIDTLMTVVTDVTDVKSTVLAAKLFEIPAGYQRSGGS